MSERRDPPWDNQPEMDTDQLLSEWFEEEAPTREPAVLAPNVIARTALTRRRSKWFVRDWWRDLFRFHQRAPLVPALAAIGVAVVALVLVVGLVLPGGLFGEPEGDGEVYQVPAEAIRVNPDDEAVTPTIGEAIADAVDGDTVAIFPGEYIENLVIDKDITLIGGGPPESIVLRPSSPEEPIILIDGGDPHIEGFTISGSGNSVTVVASEPTFTRMIFDGVGDQWWTYTGGRWDGFDEAAPSILAELFANPTIHDNTFIGGGEIEVTGGSDATITDNTLIEGAAIFLNDAGDATVVSGNSITDSGLYSIESTSCSELTIEGNTITQTDPGIAIQAVCLTGTIRDNVIDGANVGIQLIDRNSADIRDNVIDTDGVALEIHEDVEPTLSGNELCGANAIMAVMRGGMPLDLTDNTLCDEAPLIFD